MKRLILSLTILLLLFIFDTKAVYAQCTLDPPGSCEMPVAICDADLVGGLSIDMSMGAPDGGNGYSLCNNGTVQNITFFAFTAGTTSITFELLALNCSNPSGMGAGIQWGLAEDGTGCADGSEIECNSGANVGLITISSDEFIVGQDYVIYVDGFGGSVCDLTIEVTEGMIGLDVGTIGDPDPEFDGFVFDPPLVGNELCLGGSIGFSVTPPTGTNADLQFTIDPATPDYPDGIIDVPDGSYQTIIEFNTLGTFDLCGFAFNCCDSSNVACQTFEVVPIPVEELPDEIVCQNDLDDGYTPEGWQGSPIFEPGDYSIEIESPNYACDLEQTVFVEARALQPAELVNMMVCGPPTVVNICNVQLGQESEDFPQVVLCPGADINGCDSTINLILDFVFIQTILFDPECVDGMLEFQVGYGGNVNDYFKYDVNFTMFLDGEAIWTENGQNWNPITDLIVVPIAEGNYTLEITIERFGEECLFNSNTINAGAGNLIPDDPELEAWNINPCILDSVTYALTANNDPDNIYNWDVSPPDGLTIVENNTEIGINWENAVAGQIYTICVEADNGCGKSPPICEDIEVIAQPIASFSLPDSICLNSSAILEYNGTPLSSGEYIWNFDGGTIDAGDDNSPGPFTLEYSTTGVKNVSVLVNQGACISEIFLDSIVVVNELAAPLITCMSETDMIEFTWDEIADGYIVTVLDAPAGAIFDEQGGSLTVTGLDPNDVVEIQLTAIDNGVCSNVFTITDCIAQNCAPVLIEVDEVLPICLTAGSTIVDLEAAISPFDTDAIIEWTGPGIVDAAEGLFDPSVANAGTHNIVINYTTDCPYNEAITIEVLEQPVSTFTATDTICITDVANINYTGTFSGGVFDWDFDDGNATGSGSTPFDISWDTPGLKTVQLTVENNGCISDQVPVNVLVQDTLQPLVIDCDPQTNDITFTWNSIANASGYIVSINGNEIGEQQGTSYFVDGLQPGNIVNISVVAISTNRCANVSDFESCTALNCPPVLINLMTDNTSICLDNEGNTIQITPDIVGGEPEAITTWIGTGVSQSGEFDPAISGTGIFEIIFEYTNLGCTETDTIDMSVLPTPVASFDANATVCITDSLDLDFTGMFDVEADFEWINPDGNVVTIGDEIKTGFSTPGTYTLELTLNENGCISETFELDVEVQDVLSMPAPGFDCDPNTESIVFSWPQIDCAGSYTVFVDGMEVTTTTANIYQVTDLDPDQEVEFEIIANSDCACGDVSFSIDCSTEACPALNVQVEDTDEICLDEFAAAFQLEYTLTGSPDISNIEWEGMGVSSSGMFDPNLSGAGTHFVSVAFNVGNCEYFASSFVDVNETPTAEIVAIDPSCADTNNGSIEVNASGGTGDYTILINNQPLVGNSVDTLAGNSYTVTVIDEKMCQFTETFILTQPTLEDVNIAGNTTIIAGDVNTYSISSDIPTSEINTVTWFDTAGTILCSGIECLNFEFGPENDITVCAIVDYGSGCVAEDCIDIRAERIKQVYIPNTFTPNEDGVNDFWLIFPNDEVVSMPLVQVFNRWGEKMFEVRDLALDGTSPGWDGQFKGRRLNPGVYIYQLNVVYEDGTSEVINGDITIVN